MDFHSRKHLPNAGTQNPYDAVFTNHRRKFAGPSPIDYHEIFGGSQNSSIPVLDLSTLGQNYDSLSFNIRDSKPDYSKIFGGFCEQDVAVSYQDLFGQDKLRAPSSASPNSQDSDNLSHQFPDASKQFNMSYNKINPKFKDGLDGTKHVTQVPAVTGFTCFVDKPVMEAKKPNLSAVNVKPSRNVVRRESNDLESISNEPVVEAKKPNLSAVNVKSSRNVDRRDRNHLESVFEEPIMEAKKQNPSAVNFKSSRNVVRRESNHLEPVFDEPVMEAKKPNPSAVNAKSSRKAVGKESNHLESIFDDKKSRTFNIDFENHKDDQKRSRHLESSKPDFDGGIDVNSDASAALRKAIEKAQESIRIAKESVGRKKNGLRSFSNKKFKKSLKPEDEESSQNFQDVGRNRKYGSTGVVPNFMESEKLFVAKKFIDEISEKISESVKDSKYRDDSVACNEAVAMETSKIEIPDFVNEDQTDNILEESEEKDTNDNENRLDASVELQENVVEHEEVENAVSEKHEAILKASEWVKGESGKQENVLEHEDSENAESEQHEEILEASERVKSENESEHDKQENVFEYEDSKYAESENHEAILEASERVKSDEPAHDKQENVLDHEDSEYAKSENHEAILEASERVESENESKHDKQENVLEHEDSEFAKSEKHEEIFEASERVESENESEHDKQENVLDDEGSEYAESEKHDDILEASEWADSENESKHDQISEETDEMFDDFCETDAKDIVQTFVNKLEENGMILHDDCEIKQEDSDNKLEENEVNPHDDCEIKQEGSDNKLEESEVNHHDDCEIKQEDSDNKLEESEVNHHDDCEIKQEDSDNKLEESEVNLHDDCESKQEEDHTGETKGESLDDACDQEFDEKSSSDNNVMEETDNMDYVHDASNSVEMNDINAETTQTASDDEDEYEVKSEEENIIDNMADLDLDNDARLESSSDSIIRPPHKEIPDAEKSNEVKDSHEPDFRHKVEESGPSRVSQKAHFNKIDEEATVKRREWEKNRLAVERAIREARERAFAEARERAERERAAVEKAKEEVRQRMVAEAHEKVSKASTEKATSTERAKLRAERAAVERATSEARQRALEKAISQKTASDVNRTESALRTKAKLEKHNRIMERAAKALAEKEKRDRLAQKEQAERNRIAESLDADIKRWSKGKEGNLRALLSTLQYILGPESGWQPVTLTEIITASAVKKAYRKATLCVHPDKLQQRGATIQQKYICEKVFDLLKAAWNRFNSEER